MHLFRLAARAIALHLIAALLPTGPALVAQCTTPSPTAYWQSHSAGCGSPPLLACSDNPIFGRVMTLDTTNFPASTIVVVTVMSFSAPSSGTTTLLSLTLPTGCLNYMTGTLIPSLAYPFGSGLAQVALPIPLDPLMHGTVLHAQSGAITLGTPWIELSNAVCLYVGP